MSRSKPHPIRVSAVKAALGTPLYRQRVARDRTKYDRNDAKLAGRNDQPDFCDEPLDRFDAEYGDCDGSFEYAQGSLSKKVITTMAETFDGHALLQFGILGDMAEMAMYRAHNAAYVGSNPTVTTKDIFTTQVHSWGVPVRHCRRSSVGRAPD